MYDNEHFSNFKQVAVLRSLEGLGDFLCIVPALRSLRTALPQAKIALVGLQKTQALVQRFHQYLDELLVFPGYPGLPEQEPQVQQIPTFLAAAQKQQFDLALQMHGSGVITNPIALLLGAKRNAGFFLPEQYCPDAKRFLPYPKHEPEVRRYLRLLSFLGIPAQGEALEFPLQEADYQALKAVDATYNLRRGCYVCIHPGASVVERRWSPKQFAIVADALAQRGCQIVLTGTSEELPIAHAVAQLMQAESLNLAGCTTLGALAVLLKGSRLLVCNDTGISHLADALQVPSVVIFTASDPQRWAPLNRDRHRVLCHATGATAGDAIAQADALLQQPIATDSVSKLQLSEIG
ncbi:MAG: glycosyltransferase family 9 protein [Tildeniella nuda ZEHNDER 1965/U140]|jgi:ADP-heptose:LPS heptosyltransferase|nr:glycosyltransferase family 9 protein [Tildeniella nuda ZEHNDER 1965/U140]